MYALRLAADGRVLEIMDARYQTEDTPMIDDYPQAVKEGCAYDYRYIDGDWVYDPVRPTEENQQPGGDQPSLEDRVTAVECDVANLTAAVEKGLNL